ncbi:MAG: hypothetical protein ACPGLV_13890 [Bacteroidia bacterium]
MAVAFSSCSNSAQITDELNWKSFKIVEYKKIEIEQFGMKESIDWPIFNESIYSFENKSVTIEGYYYCIESTNLDTTSSIDPICILTISKEPTIQICGVPQFRQNEFISIKGNQPLIQGEKIKLRGILHLNSDGSDENLISMENVSQVK